MFSRHYDSFYQRKRRLPMNPTLNERMKQIGRILLYIVLVIFLVRNSFDVVRQLSAIGDPPPTPKVVTSTEVPDEAKSVAKLFIQHWYSVGPDQDDDKRLESLKPFVTTNLFAFISRTTDLSIDNSKDSTNANNTPSNTPNTNGDQQQPFTGTHAVDVDVMKAVWEDQAKGDILVDARLSTSDDKVLYLSLPVVKSGNTWQVDSLPALIPQPVPNTDTPDEDPGVSIENDETAITTMLDGFFGDWLKGNTDLIKLYMANGKSIPSSDWLGEEALNGTYEGVQEIEAVSNKPLKIKASVLVKDQNNVKMMLNYTITLEKKNSQWFIVSID
jgi:hypothetical protein